MPWYLGNTNIVQSSVMGWVRWSIVPLLLWSLVWKGMALWHAGRRDEKPWFILLLIVNTMGILEIVYLVFVAKLFASKKHPRAKKKKG
jgi:methionyl-tRNA synthetase